MSKLRWNSKQLLSKQFDNQSNTSNKSSAFEKFGRFSRDTSFVQQKQMSAVKKLKRSTIINGSHLHSKSSTSIMCDVKRGKMKFITNILNSQEEHQQKPQKINQKKKIDIIIDQVYVVLKDVQSLFTEIKKGFRQFQEYTIKEYKKMQASFTSLSLKQCYQSNMDKINKNTNCSTLETLKTQNTLWSTKNGNQTKNKVIILTPSNDNFIRNNVRKTQSFLTYGEGKQYTNLNQLSPNKQISYQDRPVFQSLRSKITKRSNITEKLGITHSQIQIQKSPPRFIKTPRKKSDMFSSSLSQIPSFSRLNQSAYSSRETSPAVKQVQQKIDMAIKTMKNAFVNK